MIKMSKNNIMVDLETMGHNTNAAIVSIGAVKFNEVDGITDSHYEVVSLESSTQAGLETSPETILWWLKQKDEAKAMFQEKTSSLEEALLNFTKWIGDEEYDLWGNGSDFDPVVLSSSYSAIGLENPIKFYNHRCYRTLKSLFPDIKIERTGTYHNALDDARNQAVHLLEIVKRENLI